MQKLKFLNDRVHGMLDYTVVLVFALAPTLLGVVGPSAVLCYVLAVVHLVMTLFTDMPLSLKKVIPIGVHGTIEVIVGLAILIAPWIFSDLLASGQLFFTFMGALIFFVWATSNYGDKKFEALA
jgi:hypothetical protein